MKIGIIGAGNMASALLAGFLSSEIVSPSDVFLSDMDTEKLLPWTQMGVGCFSKNETVIEKADVVIFAVKPSVLPIVLKEMGVRKDEKLYISIAAGFSIEKIKAYLGEDAKIIRVMPNTPALVKCGMTVISKDEKITDDELEIAKKLFMSVGEVVCLDEKYINAATAIHSSSPAFIYMLIDAMADAGLKYGIDKKTAKILAAKAVEGSAKMVLSSDEHIMQLKDNVCSPAGTTIEAVLELERRGFKADIQSAIKVCVEKANNL